MHPKLSANPQFLNSWDWHTVSRNMVYIYQFKPQVQLTILSNITMGHMKESFFVAECYAAEVFLGE